MTGRRSCQRCAATNDSRGDIGNTLLASFRQGRAFGFHRGHNNIRARHVKRIVREHDYASGRQGLML